MVTARRTGRPLGSKTLRGVARFVHGREVEAVMRIVGRRIRDARIERGLSAAAVGKAIGSGHDLVLRIEGARFRRRRTLPGSPRSGASLSTLVRIALALDMTLHELMP